ncbi:uncharacterized protein M421DRAFT_255126 [Didymella exigua CBS 183.55]|uniref:BTB domain-containing protein n=1 Tax=Didymella exigua CBS 183.55 TaxID=1150837 RepID=A0A6A5RYT4_9PLEO|nr:uncharacterized protein M421DRAFT_255126 [Didymella exigua CBS 183.55]KAF1933022.1 hypothetical protein M421DRAFT_255126 [Didymella exigua CBS 183.55]
MDDITFIDTELGNEYGASDAILKAVLPDGKVIHISNAISPFKFLETCPLLYHTFEYNAQSRLQASIEASSETAVISLARYCYTGSYLADEPDGDSILLLQHAETYKIAEDFDVPELEIMAHGNFSCQIEFACCLPKHPRDLLDTIRFIYRHFASDDARRNHNLVDTLLNYCVAVYLYHKLGESLDFLTAVREIPAFRQDLCRTNITRNFEDDCAAEIIRLPSSPMAQSSNAPTTLASRELPSAMLFNLPRNPATTDPASIKTLSIGSTTAFQRANPTFTARRAASDSRRRIPDRSKHSVSAPALSAALLKFTNIESSDEDDTDRVMTVNDALRRYKRARVDKTSARLEGRPLLPEADPSSGPRIEEERSIPLKVDDDSNWDGAFGETETQVTKIATGGTSQSARRLLLEYGRRNARPLLVTQLSKSMTDI